MPDPGLPPICRLASHRGQRERMISTGRAAALAPASSAGAGAAARHIGALQDGPGRQSLRFEASGPRLSTKHRRCANTIQSMSSS